MPVYEVAGLAGSGKSTIARALSVRDKTVQVGFPLRRIQHLPSLAVGVFSSFPASLGSRSWLELGTSLYISALLVALRRRNGLPGPNIILDQGPLYLLAHWGVCRGESGSYSPIKTWELESIRTWAGLCSRVFFLDAPDDSLVERIRAREQAHRIKAMPRDHMALFLQKYRLAYERILDTFMSFGGSVLHIQTGDTDIDKALGQIYKAGFVQEGLA